MSYFLAFLLFVAMAGCGYLAYRWWRAQLTNEALVRREAEAARQRAELEAELEKRRVQIARLAKWQKVDDAVEKARQLMKSAEAKIAGAEERARILLVDANAKAAKERSDTQLEAKRIKEEAQAALDAASAQAGKIIDDANKEAERIAGKAYDAVRNAELYEKTAKAMKNQIEGYGDEYIKPAESLLDDLAEEFAHKDAGEQLKLARKNTKALIKNGRAGTCDYVDDYRRKGAEAFVIDAFNGKVDSILSRVRHDNFGTLEQQIQDAFSTVNYGGKPFRNARITEEFLAARLIELKWAVVAQELKEQEREEQREFRQWIREEQKAQREFEKAQKEAEKERKMLREAMAQAEAQIAAATEEQRAEFEAQLADYQARLQVAEEKNQRALSMAQQTRAGHVYIISNIGSFGDHLYKIGLTRRLEPMERIKELGDASVPFEFDVHAVIYSEDAPALETKLHKQFVLNQVNKVNHRKEFFRLPLSEIREEVEELGVDAKWTMRAEAREYRESLAIEKMIADDPAARDAWLNRQLELESDTVQDKPVAAPE